ncbi:MULTISPECIES: SH3 domain-containing protein [Arthrospira]|uniref:SH3 type 3 domain protein n=1 Tax=Limnospira platensis NIES-46 TaxID=1236695 RepID=A0A5M3T8Y1_LIMPL|nr:SH3 domain-containing protein [Arthrospira platensis]AMW28235.1 peptide-binding protein [Arthrospira platensis YZ]KDR56858.1 peptide-binding protein [Arthrospira platensis str. Paraca]MBD2711547.1 SH3 domain-containing protein [Arthrospira platensis FACHB-835]MDF2209381.1 SH3 domain-containing protein [Arthrospira platensis NCB002]MDT9311855.1 SH3 domain-containing protein [Limnospira sp. Paracas R14]QQW31029.1 SH3 domain-containing protein [Arthrospira sp. PCC 9108]BAI90099.1 SH3 type 3 
MSFQPKQLIVASVAGLVTAVIVAAIAIQWRSSQETPAASPQPTVTESPVPSAPSEAPGMIESPPIVVRPPTTGCEITMAIVQDPDPPLNVRRSPQVQEGNIVGQLPNNTFISVVNERDGWLEISDPVPGWVAKNRTHSSCPNVRQRIEFLPGGNSAIIQGEIIGGGSHSYTLEAEAGQTLTVTAENSIFPYMITPDGQLLGDDVNANEQLTEWTGVIPESGTYTFQLDSNFRGFTYEFLVRLEE